MRTSGSDYAPTRPTSATANAQRTGIKKARGQNLRAENGQ